MGNCCGDSQVLSPYCKTIGRITAVLVAALGLLTITTMIYSIWQVFHDTEKHLSDIFFVLGFSVLPITFGVYCLFVARSIWSGFSAKNARQISLIMALLMSFLIIGLFYEDLKSSIWKDLSFPLIMIIAGSFYILCSKTLIKWFSLQETVDWNQCEKSTRRFVGWIAFFVWVACVSIVMHSAMKDSLWAAIAVFALILPLHLIYKLCVKIILRNKPENIGAIK